MDDAGNTKDDLKLPTEDELAAAVRKRSESLTASFLSSHSTDQERL
jgi:hypothetical protein